MHIKIFNFLASSHPSPPKYAPGSKSRAKRRPSIIHTHTTPIPIVITKACNSFTTHIIRSLDNTTITTKGLARSSFIDNQQELQDQNVGGKALTDLDLDHCSNGKVGAVYELFPPGSNHQASISGIDGVPTLDHQTLAPHDKSYFTPSTGFKNLRNSFGQFLIQSKRYNQQTM